MRYFQEMLSGKPAPGEITIIAAGQIMPVGPGCSYSGTITPDAEKNFFNVSITFGSAPCNPANQTISGVALEMLLPDGVTRQLLIIGKQSTFGFAGLR